MSRILLIEDDEIIRSLLVKVLVLDAYEVIEACDGLDGIQLYRKHLPDLVLTDIQMPQMDGLEVIQELRQITPDLRIIVMTGRLEIFKDSLKKLNVDAVLAKPFTCQIFRDTVGQFVTLA